MGHCVDTRDREELDRQRKSKCMGVIGRIWTTNATGAAASRSRALVWLLPFPARASPTLKQFALSLCSHVVCKDDGLIFPGTSTEKKDRANLR